VRNEEIPGKFANLKKYRVFSWISTATSERRRFNRILADIEVIPLYTANKNNINSKTVAGKYA